MADPRQMLQSFGQNPQIGGQFAGQCAPVHGGGQSVEGLQHPAGIGSGVQGGGAQFIDRAGGFGHG